MLYKVAIALTVATAGAMTAWDFKEDKEWAAFKIKYQKTYKDDNDEAVRYALFKVSQERVASLNTLNKKAGDAFGINWMSDRKADEKYKKGLVKPEAFAPTAPVRDYKATRRADSPSSINWRDTKVVTAIKNQGQCGSCWAFSATEAVESQLVLSTGGKLAIDLSPQQIASCSPKTGDYPCMGCNGGFTEGAYEYLQTVPGLTNSFNVPYQQSLTQTSRTLACPTETIAAIDGEYKQLTGGYAAVKGYHYAVTPCTSGGCTTQDLSALQAALETTPVSVCVNAGTWNDYTGGVMTSAACGSMAADEQDHCVMATGFNATATTPYWIVRNSWSSTWGEDGYVYLEMSENTCGLADDATIPEVALDMTPSEVAEAAAGREALYQKAIRK